MTNSKNKFAFTELSVIRIVLLISAVLCLIGGYFFEDNSKNQLVVYIEALLCFIVFFYSLNVSDISKARIVVAYVIYLVDFANLWVAVESKFTDRMCYQYLVFFIVTSLLFRFKDRFLWCVFLNSLFLFLAIMFFPKGGSANISEFVFSYVLSTAALLLMKLNNFYVEDQLTQSENKYRLLAENSADIVCLHDLDGTFTFASMSFFVQTGYDQSSIILKNIRDLIHPDDMEEMSKAFYSCSLNKEETIVQYRLMKKSGDYIWLETVFKPMSQNNLGKILSQTRNIEHTKQVMLEIENKNKALEQSNKDMEMFSYISSHDLLEPLRMIASYIQLLSLKYSSKLPNEAQEYISFAQKGTMVLQLLIKDLLEYSSINNKSLLYSLVKLDDIVAEVKIRLSLLIEEKNAVINYEPSLLKLQIDPILFAQVIQNLIQNGIKYNNSLSPEINITTQVTPTSTIIHIIDNGTGINKEYQTYIFEPFKRLTNKFDQGGTGLGLSICRKIIEKHEGYISLYSDGENGSTFSIHLPSYHPLAIK